MKMFTNWYHNLKLQDLAHVAQVGLFVLAIFGYFYTVKPLYRYNALEEQKAKLELELKEKERLLSNYDKAIEEKASTVSKLENDVKQIQRTAARQYQVFRQRLISELMRYFESTCGEDKDRSNYISKSLSTFHGEETPKHLAQLTKKDWSGCFLRALKQFDNYSLFDELDRTLLSDLIKNIDNEAINKCWGLAMQKYNDESDNSEKKMEEIDNEYRNMTSSKSYKKEKDVVDYNYRIKKLDQEFLRRKAYMDYMFSRDKELSVQLDKLRNDFLAGKKDVPAFVNQ